MLMMLTTRYLTISCSSSDDHTRPRQPPQRRRRLAVLLQPRADVLQRMLRGDFSEYNAKTYQAETRWALLNLCTYAYDQEVRLAARMVLDYLSAKMAVSSNDLRRMLPFRRRNQAKDNSARGADGFMKVSLIAGPGSDPMAGYFAVQAGNLRARSPHSPGSRPATASRVRRTTWPWRC